MRELWKASRLRRSNWRRLMGLELFYKLLVALFFIPLLSGCFTLVMKVTGYNYITRENVQAFALNPLTLMMGLFLLLLAANFTLIDVGAVIYTLEQSRQGNHVRVADMLRFSGKNALRVWRRGNVLLVPVLLVLLPLLNLGMLAGVVNTVSIPEHIMSFIRGHRALLALSAAGILLLYYFIVRWLYAFHCFTLEGCGSREACWRSAALGRRRRPRDFATLLLVQTLFGAAVLAVVLLMALLATLLGRLLTRVYVLSWLTSTAVWFAAMAALVIAFAYSTPVACICVSQLYYRHKSESGEPVIPLPAPAAPADPIRDKRLRAVYICAAALIATGSVYLGYLINTGALNPQIEYLRTMEITAHRGASSQYPENTMAAFRGAWELGADWVELDVQQTRDGQIIVLHDTNLRRTTGLNKRTWELDYEEIAKLDAGSRFGVEFAGEPIPLLSEVAEYARDTGLRLNIELKPSGHEVDFEQGVIDIIREYGIEDRCVITSQVYQVLENVKALDEEISTVYVMSLAYGNINKLDAADHFSVEATSATYRLVSRVHNAGKQVYAWTVNTKAGINRMINRNVDNIVTDNIELARQCVAESRYGELLSELVKTLEE